MRFLALLTLSLFSFYACANDLPEQWKLGPSIFHPGEKGAFDETAVKDPSIFFYDDAWHLFYTARGHQQYSIGYATAPTLEELDKAPRHCLKHLTGKANYYAAAPQAFYFSPQKCWYLIYQTTDLNYQPVFSTTTTLTKPDSWTTPSKLLEKDEKEKWIDFWVICDDKKAYLFYTRSHHDIYLRTTSIEEFPKGFGEARRVFGPVHEAVHIYKVKEENKYHLIYEMRAENRRRRFGLAQAPALEGPWKNITDTYASGEQLYTENEAPLWSDEVSHGEALRTSYDEKLEYDPAPARWLIQGIKLDAHHADYAELSWSLGVITAK